MKVSYIKAANIVTDVRSDTETKDLLKYFAKLVKDDKCISLDVEGLIFPSWIYLVVLLNILAWPLVSLNLSGALKSLSRENIMLLSESLEVPPLEELILSSNAFKHSHAEALFSSLLKVKHVDLSGNDFSEHFDDEHNRRNTWMETLLARLQTKPADQLPWESLVLKMCNFKRSEGMLALGQLVGKSPNLVRLDVSENNRMDRYGVRGLLQHLSALAPTAKWKELSFAGLNINICDGVIGDSLYTILHKTPDLQLIDLTGCGLTCKHRGWLKLEELVDAGLQVDIDELWDEDSDDDNLEDHGVAEKNRDCFGGDEEYTFIAYTCSANETGTIEPFRYRLGGIDQHDETLCESQHGLHTGPVRGSQIGHLTSDFGARRRNESKA